METERLFLRPFKDGDASAIQSLAGSIEIARNTFISHPYENGMAVEFIDQPEMKAESGKWANLAVVLKKRISLSDRSDIKILTLSITVQSRDTG